MADDSFIQIKDTRPTATEHANFTGAYPKSTIEALVRAANLHGINPYTALAVSMQENRLGQAAKTGGVGWGAWLSPKTETKLNAADLQKAISKRAAYEDQLNEIRGETGTITGGSSRNYWSDPRYVEIQKQMGNDPDVVRVDSEHFARALKDKLDYGRRIKGSSAQDAHIIQAYNGYGKSAGDSGEIIDRMQNPVYGKQVVDLRDYVFKNHPEIRALVGAVKGENAGIIRNNQTPQPSLVSQ